MKDYDAYLFDWDGTLTMTHDVALDIVRKQLQRYDFNLSDQQIVDKLFGRYVAGMEELGVPAADMPALKAELHGVLKVQMPLAELYPGALDLLRHLRDRRKMALITATMRDIIDLAIARHELPGMFDVIVTGDEVSVQKPHPEGVLTALHALGVQPGRAVMIGDSKKDILAGKSAGTDTILFYPPEHSSQHDLAELKVLEPTYIVTSWHEMIGQLK